MLPVSWPAYLGVFPNCISILPTQYLPHVTIIQPELQPILGCDPEHQTQDCRSLVDNSCVLRAASVPMANTNGHLKDQLQSHARKLLKLVGTFRHRMAIFHPGTLCHLPYYICYYEGASVGFKTLWDVNFLNSHIPYFMLYFPLHLGFKGWVGSKDGRFQLKEWVGKEYLDGSVHNDQNKLLSVLFKDK